ncbi:hypothetical protein OS12_13230 [Dickeya oryzae]
MDFHGGGFGLREIIDVLTGYGQRCQACAQHHENDNIAKHIPTSPAGLKTGSLPEEDRTGKLKKYSIKCRLFLFKQVLLQERVTVRRKSDNGILIRPLSPGYADAV